MANRSIFGLNSEVNDDHREFESLFGHILLDLRSEILDVRLNLKSISRLKSNISDLFKAQVAKLVDAPS